MKLLSISLLVLALSSILVAQVDQPDRDFQKNRKKYTREHFVMGEDASSGYDYLYYKSGQKIVMIRVIWSASHSTELRIDDFYLDGEMTLHRTQTARKSRLGALKRGLDVPMVIKEERYFSNGHMTKWISGGKPIDSSSTQWTNAEKESLEHAKSEIEAYALLKEDNPNE